ncbi:hypothetical protein SDC9_175579 [bioreactor metagenome]|uniref:Uncharacterized protein n=1 Tax=bioreactor metagenome TaxID=1076179 RepID=A0A645GPJ8_9ZZZZ
MIRLVLQLAVGLRQTRAERGNPQHRLHLRLKDAFRRTLGNEIVAPHLDRRDQVGVAVCCRDEDDRRPGPGFMPFQPANPGCRLETVHPRHLDVHQHEVEGFVAKHVDRRLTVVRMAHFVTEGFQTCRRDHGDRARVIDQKDFHDTVNS